MTPTPLAATYDITVDQAKPFGMSVTVSVTDAVPLATGYTAVMKFGDAVENVLTIDETSGTTATPSTGTVAIELAATPEQTALLADSCRYTVDLLHNGETIMPVLRGQATIRPQVA